MQIKKIDLANSQIALGSNQDKPSNTSTLPFKYALPSTTNPTPKVHSPKSSMPKEGELNYASNETADKIELGMDKSKRPVERIEIKQQTVSASYLTSNYQKVVKQPSGSVSTPGNN